MTPVFFIEMFVFYSILRKIIIGGVGKTAPPPKNISKGVLYMKKINLTAIIAALVISMYGSAALAATSADNTAASAETAEVITDSAASEDSDRA